MKPIHDAAAKGYQSSSDSYERGRPEYPDEAVRFLIDRLSVRAGTTLVDLGAGTGKFTKLIVGTGARIMAVEPVAAMREKLSSMLPLVEVLAGTAESIPLPEGSVDGVVVAQAFHWFNGPEALSDIHRILRPGGRLGLIWNVRDESVDWVARLTGIVDVHEGDAPRYRTGNWRRAFAGTRLFTFVEERQFRYVQSGPPSMVEDRVASISFISALPEARRADVLRQVRELIQSNPETRGAETIRFPYRTEAFIYDRTAD